MIFAAKELTYNDKDDKDRDKISSEISIMQRMQHPNIAKFIEAVMDSDQKLVYIMQEYCKGEPLISKEDLVAADDRPLALDITWTVFRDTLDALEYMHNQKIIHLDLKPDNIMLCEGPQGPTAKLIDFGESQVGKKATQEAGTTPFMAPEVLGLIGRGQYSGTKADIYSLGATLYTMIFGRLPFPQEKESEIYQAKMQGISFPYQTSMSESTTDFGVTELDTETEKSSDTSPVEEKSQVQEKSQEERDEFMFEMPCLCALLRQMMHIKYRKRPTATRAKNHPWVTKHGTVDWV